MFKKFGPGANKGRGIHPSFLKSRIYDQVLDWEEEEEVQLVEQQVEVQLEFQIQIYREEHKNNKWCLLKRVFCRI